MTFAIRGAVVQNVNYECLKKLKEAGLRRIQFGIETTSERLLGIINKKIDRQKIADAIAICNRLKIGSVANLMIGLPTQTESEIVEDIEFIKKVNPRYISISIFNYAPNTEFYTHYLKENPTDDFWRKFARNPDREFIHHCDDIITYERLYHLQSAMTKKVLFSAFVFIELFASSTQR